MASGISLRLYKVLSRNLHNSDDFALKLGESFNGPKESVLAPKGSKHVHTKTHTKAGGAEAKENWVSVSVSATANGVGAAASTSYGITLGQNDVVDYDELADDMPPIFIISFEL